jgi:SAM-dependent methyltransferase
MAYETQKCGVDGCPLPSVSVRDDDFGMEFFKCHKCGAMRIPNDELDRLTVPPDPIGTDISLPMRVLFGMRDRWFQSCLPGYENKEANILDFGCGDGQFLQFLGTRGFEKRHGLEVNPERAAHALKRGVNVHSDISAVWNSASDQFDLIFIWHALEHLEFPVEVLRSLFPLLAERGAIIVGVPNQDSLQNRLFGRMSSLVDYGRHVWYWRQDYFSWLDKKYDDWNVVRVPGQNMEYELYSWLDSLVSVLLGKRNYVHMALKKGTTGFVNKIIAATLCAFFAPIAISFSVLTSIFSDASSTITYRIARAT